jgi:opacity protein-like surface antigen
MFAVGYLPVARRVDVFAKLGIGQLLTHHSFSGDFSNVYPNCQTETCPPLGFLSVSQSNNDTGLAYGVGAQFHFGALAARVEYEGVNTSLAGNPSLATLALTWSF